MSSEQAFQRVKALEQLNSNRDWQNKDLYRLMYKEDFYVLAYERVKSKPGNMTPGTDGETLDGFSMDEIQSILRQMRDETFQFKPVRTVLIPKANGKMRKLGIPSVRDKIVQEVMRMILEAIYDSPQGPYFHESSHGFRRNRSCHTALREFRTKWSAVNWIIEGDIRACFDEIDHGVLESILRKKIVDERFINLVRKLLKAGYMDMRDERKDSLAGTPQGGIVSPILANIYLDQLDQRVEQLRVRYERGETKRRNTKYRSLVERRDTLRKRGDKQSPEFRTLSKQIRTTPAIDPADPNFIRIKYLRYADDWIIGIQGPHSLAVEIKEELKSFLSQELNLTLSEEKTRITQARKEEATFLGTLLQIGTGEGGEPKIVITTNRWGKPFKRRSTGWETVMKAPMAKIVEKIANRGFCTRDGEPAAKAGWTNLDVDQIVSLYSGINRGIQSYYRFTDNFGSLTRIQFILSMSCAKTLGMKLKTTSASIYRKHGRELTFVIRALDGKKDRTVKFYVNRDWKVDRYAFARGDQPTDLVQMATRMRTRSKLGYPCVICGETDGVVMHHVRHIRKADSKPAVGFKAIMRALNRKQVPVCQSCHGKVHRGEYDSIKLTDLLYDLR